MAKTVLLRNFFFAFIMFTLIASSITYTLVLLKDGTPGSVDTKADNFGGDADEITKFNNTFNRLDEVSSNLAGLQGNLTGINVESKGAISTAVALISSSWDVVRAVINSIGFMDEAIKGISGYLDIPAWIPLFLNFFIIIIFVFSILGIIFGKDI